jgi:hypothetical protein
MAILLLQKLRKVKLFDTSSWTLGVRVQKQRDLLSSDAPPQRRGVLSGKLLTSFFSQGFVQSILDHLILNKNSFMMIGVSVFNGGYIRIRQPGDEVYHTLEGDWEYFDFQIMEEHIDGNCFMFSFFFHKRNHYDNCCYFIINSLIYNNTIIPGGLTFQLNDGMPSGTSWTNLIQLLINWLIP